MGSRPGRWCNSLVFRVASVVGLAAVMVLTLFSPRSEGLSGPWTKLRRPLHIPRVAPGSACPTSGATGQLPSPPFVGTKFGRGPVYPTFGRVDQALIHFQYPPPSTSAWPKSAWSGQKVMWVSSPRYHSPTLIRGRQLDGPNRLRFDDGELPSVEKRIRTWGRNASSRWGASASLTRLRAPGCYGYQIDSLTFSRVVVFQAVLWASPALRTDELRRAHLLAGHAAPGSSAAIWASALSPAAVRY